MKRRVEICLNNLHRFIFPVLVLIAGNKISAQTASGVKIAVNSSGLLEIRNGLLGIVVIPEGAISPADKVVAPIQSFIYPDNTYSDNSPNFLITPGKLASGKVSILKNTNEQVTVQMTYRFTGKVFKLKKSTDKEAPAGNGYYVCTITVDQGKKTIAIEEETDVEVQYKVRISTGLLPDQARYRGWGSHTIEAGHEPDGKIYRDEETRGFPMDATMDISYAKPFTYPRLILWEPAGGEFNSGRYWQFYNSKAGPSANLFGYFQGPPSRLIGGSGLGPSLQVWPEDPINKEKLDAELNIDINQLWPLDKWYKRKRFQYVVYISTKKDLLTPEKIQPIALEMNRVSGLATVIKKYATDPVTLIPAFYRGGIYMPANQMAAFRNNIGSDLAFYQQMCAVESLYKPIWDAWRYPDSAKSLLKQLLSLEPMFIEQYTVKHGTYTNIYRYWKGARMFKLYALSASCLLVEPLITITDTDKKKLEQLIGLMARIVWDDNNVPMWDSAGVNMGPANMEFQYRNNARVFFALLLANDPEFKERAKKIVVSTGKDIASLVYPNGSTFGTPHYMQPAIDPTLFTVLQLRQAGLTDDDEWENELIKFAGFCTSLLTPESVRFSGNRKLVSFGDGSEESAAMFGLLATVFRYSKKALSDQLMIAFHKGPTRSSFAGPVMLAVDMKTLPAQTSLKVATSNYTGYLSHFRSAPNTDQESALWFINGDDYYDHRNDDAGEVAIYALGAPLSLSRSSFYYPSANDGRIRSLVVPEKLFPEWNKSEQPITGRSLTNRTWPKSSILEFANLGRITYASGKMEAEGKSWQRNVSVIMLDDKTPAYVFYDSISGNENNIWSMTMMSEGAVNTPAGAITPEKRMHNARDLQQLPSATPSKNIPAGWNRFLFNGQSWKLHPSGGIDWYLYTNASKPVNFTLSHWGTTFQNNLELAEFKKTNGRDYTEEQQILRMQSNEPFFSILLPFNKGNDVYGKNITTLPGRKIKLKTPDGEWTIGKEGYNFAGKDSQIVALVNGGKKIANPNGTIALEGGSMIVECKGSNMRVRVHGNTGTRKITVANKTVTVSGKNAATVSKTTKGSVITIAYKSNSKDLSPGQQGYTEYLFTVK